MYFKSSGRHNPATGQSDWYYRLVESYRNSLGEVRQRTLLSVGFIDYLSADQLKQIVSGLNSHLRGEILLCSFYQEKIRSAQNGSRKKSEDS